MAIKQVSHTHIKQTKRALRLWIEGQKLTHCGFAQGAAYNIGYNSEAKEIILELSPNGSRKVTAASRPIIDLHSNEVGKVFAAGDRIEVIFEQGVITCRLHHEASNQESREAEFKQRSQGGVLREASLFTGGGVSTAAIHSAMADSNQKAKLVWIAEAETKYIEAAGSNCLAIDDDTVFLAGMVEALRPQYFTKCDILSFSMPCAGFSNAGKVKHKLTEEAHSGTALFGVVNAIRNANPAICISENVVEARDSAIYCLLKAELVRLGYKIFEQVLDSSHTDSLENRKRYWLTAISSGIAPSTFEIPKAIQSGRCLSTILEPALESAWADNQYLKDKAITDKATGKGFSRQLLQGDEKRIGTIGRFYQKRRSTEPFMVRSDLKERLLSPREHAACKSVPFRLIAGLSASTAHEVLGQSVDYLQPYNLVRFLFKD